MYTTKSDISLTVQGLRTMYQTDPAARQILDGFAARKNASSKTYSDRLEALYKKISNADIERILTTFDDYGLGQYVIGRKTPTGDWTRSHFLWKVDLISVGQAAQGIRSHFDPIYVPEDEVETPSNLKKHSLKLRDGLSVNFNLPTDLTKTEAAKISRYIANLC